MHQRGVGLAEDVVFALTIQLPLANVPLDLVKVVRDETSVVPQEGRVSVSNVAGVLNDDEICVYIVPREYRRVRYMMKSRTRVIVGVPVIG